MSGALFGPSSRSRPDRIGFSGNISDDPDGCSIYNGIGRWEGDAVVFRLFSRWAAPRITSKRSSAAPAGFSYGGFLSSKKRSPS
jgi:hypothetical protein